jgi:hypothetical protein
LEESVVKFSAQSEHFSAFVVKGLNNCAKTCKFLGKMILTMKLGSRWSSLMKKFGVKYLVVLSV